MSEPNDPHERAVDWRNWAGDQSCRPAAVEIPGSIEEISEALTRAAAHDRRVRVAGAGHSFSDIALTDGSQLRLERLTRVLDVDRSSGLVRVQAGITIRELNVRLAEHGLGAGEPRGHRRSEHRRRDLHGDARDRRPPAQHLRAGG